MSNLYSLFKTTFGTHANRVLIDCEGRQLTGAQLDAAAARYAGVLAALGLAPGERLAVQVEKSLDNVLLYLGCLRLGAVYLPLNTAYQPAEIRYFLGDAQPRLFVAAPARRAEMAAVAQDCGTRLLTMGVDGDGELPALAAAAVPCEDVAPRDDKDLAVICYTSGTTGRSKGAMISHANLAANARALVAAWGFSDADVLLHALPLYHIHGLFVALHCAFLCGARTLLLPRFVASEVLQRLPEATVMMGVPTFYTRLLAEPALDAARCAGMRLFVSGSAPLLTDTFEVFEARTGQRILERYGMTETGMMASNPLHGERRAGTVGPALPSVELRVCDSEGRVLPAGDIGVIEVRGANVFQGYWRMPEKTAAEFRDGWFITGDLGIIEADGYVRIVGRAKDLIICGGLNVYPKEIEEAIDALPGVAESAVFGLPHADFGEAVAAVVTARSGISLDEHALMQELRSQLAAFKLPKLLRIVDELPRNAMAKVQKAALRERYRDAFTKAP